MVAGVSPWKHLSPHRQIKPIELYNHVRTRKIYRIKVLDMTQADHLKTRAILKIFVVCDQSDTAPVWGSMQGQQALRVVLEPSSKKVRGCSL